jgi:hypothetical protein
MLVLLFITLFAFLIVACMLPFLILARVNKDSIVAVILFIILSGVSIYLIVVYGPPPDDGLALAVAVTSITILLLLIASLLAHLGYLMCLLRGPAGPAIRNPGGTVWRGHLWPSSILGTSKNSDLVHAVSGARHGG